MRTKIVVPLVAFLLLFWALAQASGGRGPQEVPGQQTLRYEVSVVLKLLQVYVTDKSGVPVRDLTKDDFIVLDNGKPVTVTAFEQHEFLTPGVGQPPEKEAKIVPTALPPVPAMINRKFFLFFDFAFNTQMGAAASIKAALHFLDTEVRPADEVSVLSYSMLRGLRVHEFLTSDHAKAREAVAALTAKEIAGRADEVEHEYQQMAEVAAYAAPSGELAAEVNKLKAGRQESKLQTQNYLVTLTTLAKALRIVPGQKSFLFFSTGVPSTLVYGNLMSVGHNDRQFNLSQVNPGMTTFDMDAGDSTLQPLYETMLKEFGASNCSIYAFDTRESSKVTSLFGYDARAFGSTIGGFFSAGATGSNVGNPFVDDKLTGMDTLRRLSKQTGGQYYSNIALYEKNLDKVQDITGTYYVLGYSIASAQDGLYHDVKVDVKGKGLQVRAQIGYFNPKPFRDFTPIEKELQLFDLALNERSDFGAPKTFPMTALAYDAGEGLRLRTLAHLPKDLIEFFGGKSAELVAIFFDEKDNVLSLQRATADLDKYQGADLIFTAGVSPSSGSVKCRLVIRDLGTGQSAVASARAFLVKPDPARIAVATPLLLLPEVRITNLDGTAKGRLDLLTWHDIYPFDSNHYAPVIGDEPVRTKRIVVMVPFTIPGAEEHDVAFSAYLINSATGQNVAVPVQPLSRFVQGHAHAQLLEMALDQVPPGNYMVYINAGDRTSGALASAHVPLTVER